MSVDTLHTLSSVVGRNVSLIVRIALLIWCMNEKEELRLQFVVEKITTSTVLLRRVF